MNPRHLIPMIAALGALPAEAAQLELTLEIPQLAVAEYHRPYVAVWVEREDHSVAAQLSLWYQLKRHGPALPGAEAGGGKAQGGTKWLPDLRQWWRRGGRDLSLPADGISSATRPVGTHVSTYGADSPLAALPAGRYVLHVEAAREDGGRELLKLPFDWKGAAAEHSAQGKTELGAVRVAVRP